MILVIYVEWVLALRSPSTPFLFFPRKKCACHTFSFIFKIQVELIWLNLNVLTLVYLCLGFGTESSRDNATGTVIVVGMVNKALSALGLPLLPRNVEVPEFKHACLGNWCVVLCHWIVFCCSNVLLISISWFFLEIIIIGQTLLKSICWHLRREGVAAEWQIQFLGVGFSVYVFVLLPHEWRTKCIHKVRVSFWSP